VNSQKVPVGRELQTQSIFGILRRQMGSAGRRWAVGVNCPNLGKGGGTPTITAQIARAFVLLNGWDGVVGGVVQ